MRRRLLLLLLLLLLPSLALAQAGPATGPIPRAEKGLPGGVATLDSITGVVPDAQLRVFAATHPGVVPPSGGGTTNYLRADGAWTVPPGSVTANLTTGHIFVGNGSNVPADVAMSGACSIISTSGVVACPLGGDITGTLGAVTVTKINGQTPAAIATSGSATDLISGTVALARMPQTTVPTPTEQMLLGNATFGLPKWLFMDLGDDYSTTNAQPGTHSFFAGPGAGAHMSGTGRYYNHGVGWFTLNALIDGASSSENSGFGQCTFCNLIDGGFNSGFGNGIGFAMLHGTGNALFGLDIMRGQLADGVTLGADGSYNVISGFNAARGGGGTTYPTDYEFEVALGKSADACGNCEGLSTNNVAAGVSSMAGGTVAHGEVRQRNVSVGADSGFNLSHNAISAVLIGAFAGFENTVGGNVFIGDSAGWGIVADNTNVGIGSGTMGFINQTGSISFSVAMGWHAMAGSAQAGTISRVIAIGAQAGLRLGAGALADTLIGFDSGLNLDGSGTSNTLVGDSSAPLATTSQVLTGIGAGTLSACTTCAFVTTLGRGTAPSLTTGSRVIVIGDGDVTDVPANNTTNYLNIGNTLFADMNKMHESTGTGAPPVFGAGCGGATGTPAAGTANDDVGTIVEGGIASTTCTILWHSAYANTSRVCVVWSPNITGGVLGDDSQVDRLVITHASFTGGIIKYHCKGIGPTV